MWNAALTCRAGDISRSRPSSDAGPLTVRLDQVAFVLARCDHHSGLDHRQHRALLLRNAQLRREDRIGVERPVDRFQQRVHAFAAARRDGHFAGATLFCCEALALVRVQQVDLVQHFDARLAERIQFAQHLFHLRLLFFAIG